VLCVLLAVCYVVRPDACAAITVVPVWAWTVPGIVLTAFNLKGRGNRKGWLVLVAWVVFLFALAEEPWSVARGLVHPGRFQPQRQPEEKTLRIVSLNCAIGNRPAAEEVLAYRPDIVLLQESPSRVAVEELAQRLFGAEAGIVYGVDASLIVHGRAVPAELTPGMRGYFVQARVTMKSGQAIEVVSTRTLPAVFRADLWSPDCWREQARNRRTRREQLRIIAERIGPISTPVIVGGDFNAPQGDAAARVLGPKLRDAFHVGGIGLGDTILNEFPFLRIDQIWISPDLDPVAVVARRTRNSDHRMVIGDLRLKQKASSR
jgi:endonuclease/exonuclease/phosphatase (EEP) superfamily protein YafD